MNSQTGLPLGFEFVDIEIINHKNENDIDDRWNCDHCSLFFLSKDKLELHQKVHSFVEDTVHCKYCNKVLTGEESKECYSNKKCETCEYRCSQCPQRFLRQSSLLNHEKNHLTVKKRRSRNITFHTKQADEVDAQANNSSKKRKALKNNPEESLIETDSLQPIISPKKKSKVESDGFSPEKSKASTFVNISSRRSSRKILPDKSLTSPDKSKLNESVNKVQVVAMTDGSAKENSVNYKPFSCHVCGETFASDNGLLEHIKTHGDNAAEAFKCKYCGDKFDDIYKMQYHLAICPHAEDELESSLVKNLTPKTTPMKPSIETPSSSVNGSNPPRKRGRPFKIRNVIPPQTEPENSDNNTSASHRTRSRITKQTVVNVDPSPNTQAKLARKPRRSIKGASDFSEDCDDGVNESLGVSAKRLDESGSDDESRRKIHQCPHPSCGLKFTREKAMLCHYRNHEDSDGTVKCYKCGIPFDDDRELTTHIKECKSIKEENDSEDFEPVDEYDKKPYGKVRGGYMCKICGKTYITNDRLKRHMDWHRSSNFRCRICENIFVNKTKLEKHYVTEHPTKTPYHCDTCEEDFMSEVFLKKHLTQCNSVNKSTTNKSPTTKYNIIEDIPINETNGSANNTTELQFRLKLLRCYNYNTVSKVMSRNTNMDQFYCAVCCRDFSCKSDLRNHFRSHHVLESNSSYICQLCDVEKPTRDMLCAHLEVHSSNLLSVNRFSGLRGSYVKLRNSRLTNTNVFPNLGTVNSEEPECEEVMVEVKQKLFRKFKVGSEVKFKPRRTNKRYKKNYFTKWMERTKWMRNNNGRKVKAAGKLNEERPTIQQNSLVIKKEDTGKRLKSTPLRPLEPSKRQKKIIVNDNGESKKEVSANVNKSGRLRRSRRVGEVNDNDEFNEKIGTTNTVIFNRRKRTKKVFGIKNKDTPSNDIINTDTIDKSNGDLLNESDSDSSPQIKEDVELLLKKLSNDVDDNVEEDIIPNCKSLVEDIDATNCSKSNGVNIHGGSNKLLETELTTNTKTDVEVLPPKIIKITKSPQKHAIISGEAAKKKNSYLKSESTNKAEETINDSPDFERGEAICCTMCSMPFYNQDELLDHVGTHIYHECIVESNPLVKKKLPNMKHWCNLCELEFKNEIEENNHMIRHARMQAGFPCNMCFQICSSEKALLTHYKEAKHNKGGSRILHDLLNCSNLYEKVKENLAKDGNINFEYKMAFANNNVIKNSNTKENKWYFSCVTCNKNFDSESSVIEHEKIHLVSCPICEITLDNFQCLKEHVHKNHVKGLRNLQCKICDNKKDTEAELTNHVLVHAKRLDSHRDEVLHSIRPLETDDQNCNATVLNESVETSGLLVNKRRASYYRALNETRVSCPICLKSYSENSHLKLHLLNKHANQSDNCMCCLCQQIETSKKDLVEHLLTHKASAQDRLKSGKENLQDESDHTIDGSRISANSGIKGERAHNHVQEQGNSSASDIKFYELTNNNITVCGIVPERSDFCDSDKVDNKLLELPIKGAICTVCSETLHTPSKLGSHKNVLVYC